MYNSIEGDEQVQKDSFELSCANSFVISADMSHCYNPNYGEKSQSEHKLTMHNGIAIKINPSMRYSSDSEGSALVKEIAKKCDVPIQVRYLTNNSLLGIYN